MARKEKRFLRLRAAILESGYTLREIAEEWNIEQGTTDGRKYHNWLYPFLSGERPFKLDLCYWLMDLLNLPHEQLGLYFPKDGKDDQYQNKTRSGNNA